jgi:putative endonuclease
MAGLVPAIPIGAARVRTYWVCILASRPGGALYVGVTGNLAQRVWEHKQGRSKHTARYGIDRLVYYETYPDIRDAIQREHNIKHWPRAWTTNLIASMNPTWRDLYEELNR